jgi:lipopolysaccharide export system protein LptA
VAINAGGVLVTKNDQTATGETAVFDMKANAVTLLGGVLITRAQDVLRGDKLVIDLVVTR